MISHIAALAIALVGSSESSPVPGTTPSFTPTDTHASVTWTTPAPGTPVILVVKDNFGAHDMAALVRRFPGPNAINIIAVKRSALTPELLSAALTLMNTSIAKHGEPSRALVSASIPSRAMVHAIDAATRARMTATINQVLGAPVLDVPHVGRVRATVVRVGT